MTKSAESLTLDDQMSLVVWALDRMVELRKQGEKARFRITWVNRDRRRVYRLEIRREDGKIERPVWPLPLPNAQIVEESE